MDRVVILDRKYAYRGTILSHHDGLVAITTEGVFAPTSELHQLVRAFGEDGTLLTRIGAVPAITPERLKQILFDEYSTWARVRQFAIAGMARAEQLSAKLGWFKAPLGVVLAWLLVAASAGVLWLARPARLAVSAMPAAGAPASPPWK
jgi:hypothetical protein